MAKYLIGIDPGLNGGVSFLDTEGQTLHSVLTPTFQEKKKDGKKKTQFDMHAMADMFDLDPTSVIAVFIEQVNAMPGQGVTSMFRFGFGFGLWQGIIIAKRLPLKLVSPRAWKVKYDLHADKEASRRKASELFPQCTGFWKLKKHDGVAESALLAHYGAIDFNQPVINVAPTGGAAKRQVLLG